MASFPIPAKAEENENKPKATIALLQMKALALKNGAVTLVKDPQFQTCTITTAGGTVTLGAVGGAFGVASGVVVGGAVGVVPALFTFGLSIPIGAFIGGAGGLVTGSVVGGGVGGIAGYGAYKYRIEIKNNVVFIKMKSLEKANATKRTAFALTDAVTKTASSAVDATKAKTYEITDLTRRKAVELATRATSTRSGVMATSAMAGTVACSVAGGSVGTVVGGLVGIVPAIFTFGLSIPVGAGIGLCCGTVAGGTAGAVGGSAVGYGGFTYRKEISGAAEDAWAKVATATGRVRTMASETVSQVKKRR